MIPPFQLTAVQADPFSFLLVYISFTVAVTVAAIIISYSWTAERSLLYKSSLDFSYWSDGLFLRTNTTL